MSGLQMTVDFGRMVVCCHTHQAVRRPERPVKRSTSSAPSHVRAASRHLETNAPDALGDYPRIVRTCMVNAGYIPADLYTASSEEDGPIRKPTQVPFTGSAVGRVETAETFQGASGFHHCSCRREWCL